MNIESHLDYITHLASKGGPDPHEYEQLDEWFHTIAGEVRKGALTRQDVRGLWTAFGDALSVKTLQGFVVRKPHGRAGDYEILDKIYTRCLSRDPHLVKWDLFFHSRKAPQAVRNRKDYFLNIVSHLERTSRNTLTVLNAACGPGRDVFEYCTRNPSTKMRFHCVDMDPNGVEYAKALCEPFLDRITFCCETIFRFRPVTSYDLVWAAGLFDYFDDRTFKRCLKRLFKMARPGGEVVIGNFSTSNPTRDYMEFGEWFLNHRDKRHLMSLALDCGIPEQIIRFGQEAEGINFFLHLRKQQIRANH